MQSRLAGEGVWVEPASAAGLAGLAELVRNGEIDLKGQRVVAVCTGHGLKDPDIITRRMAEPVVVTPTLQALEEVLRL
jgi:threonine synthase